MWRSRFLWQLYFGFVALILVTTVVVGYLLAQQIEEDTLDEARETLRRNALLLREIALPRFTGVETGPIQERVLLAGKELGVRLTIIGKDGIVLADSTKDPSEMDDHSNRDEIRAARETGEGASVRFSQTVGMEMIYHALAVEHDDELVGFVRTSLPLEELHDRLSRLRARVLIGATIAGGVALLFSFFYSRRITSPLRSLTVAAESIARGNYRERVRISSRDEIGDLSRSLNTMAEQLNERINSMTREENKVITILASMIEGVVAVDRAGRILHMNETAGRILRVYRRPSEGQHLYEVTRVKEVGELLRGTLQDGRERREEVRLPQEAGERVIEAHVSPLRDGSGDLAGGVIILHDITDIRRLETVRRDFVANVSHELKTPVTAIRGLVETMLETDDMDQETRMRFLDKVRNQSNRLASLVSDLLTLSRVESRSEREPGEKVRFDVREAILDSVRRALVVAEEKGVALDSQIPREEVPISGDEEGLRKIVDNLIDNAIKYTPRGGSVFVRVAREDEVVTIEVEDTGIGIEEEDQERIFERFYRVDKARSREVGGTGLGLSIVKHFVSALGGTIQVTSKPEKGSRFRVEIPMAGR